MEEARIRHIVKTYSDHISFPVKFNQETLNEASAIWTRNPKEVTEEQHTEFYHHIAHAYDQPWMVIHNRVEGLVSYTNLLYIPSTPAIRSVMNPNARVHVKLYVNRVFITEDTKGLLPPYLRFFARHRRFRRFYRSTYRVEMLQSDPKLAKIRTGLTKKLLGELKKMANKNPDEYAKFWGNFGAVLKEGLVDDASLRDRILEICRFTSTNSGELTSLAQYIERIKEGQDAIYYIAGEDAAKIAKSPHLEGFKAKGVEVILLSDSVDEFWMQHILEFEGKKFKSITRGSADLDAIKDESGKDDKKNESSTPEIDRLIASIKLELGESVKDVRPSKRLTSSPVCLIADDGDMDVNLERLLQRHGQVQGGMLRVLEINPSHAIVKKLAKRAALEKAGSDGLLKDAAHLLLDQARIADGEAPSDVSEFGRRLNAVMDIAL